MSSNVAPMAHGFEQQLVRAFQTLRKLLIGMDEQLLQAMFALATGEHVLWHAGPGVAKSMAADLIMSLFPDARTLRLQLTKDTPKDAVFGYLIPRELIDNGREVRNLEGGIAEVEFFFADEIFDASPWMLRAMLNVINERVYRSKDGGETSVPLHTVLATSNFSRNTGEYEAVVDRFLAKAVMPTADHIDQLYMIGRGFINPNLEPLPRLRYEDLLGLRRWIESPDGVKVEPGILFAHYVLEKAFLERRYQKALGKWASENDVDMSDPGNVPDPPTMRQLGVFITPRTAAKALDFVRANAVFSGRSFVAPDDLRAAGLAYLVIGDGSGESELWKATCDEMLGLRDRDIAKLGDLAKLAGFVAQLESEKGVDSNGAWSIGGASVARSRGGVIKLRQIFASGPRKSPIIAAALSMIDVSLNHLSVPNQSLGVIVPGWR